jgi:leader peptidase (prepilin peptidase) / N-methyltransferase
MSPLPDTAVIILITVSPFIGSFAATVVVRALQGRSLMRGRSACDACQTQLPIKDAMPIIPWVVQGGRCRTCHARISLFYPAIEVAFLIVAVWALLYNEERPLAPTLLLGFILLTLFAFDFRAFILPNALTLPLLLMGLLLAAFEDRETLATSFLGAICGGAFLLAVAEVYKALRGREGLGLGDAKLFAVAGAWVGLQGLPSVLLIGSAASLVFAFLTPLRARTEKFSLMKIPFGAGLCVGFWLTWLYGPLSLGG